MKAIVAYGAGDLRVDEVPEPELPEDKVLVDIVYGGICGSDLHYHQLGRNGSFELREPLVLGHEVVGRIAAIGTAAAGHAVANGRGVGAAVAIHPATPSPEAGAADGNGINVVAGGSYLGSAATWPHSQGGFVQRLVVRPNQLRLIPDDLPLRRAALAEPLSVALHGVDRVRPLIPGASILVRGAGPIGCLVVAALRERGAGTIAVVDLHRKPLEVAAAVGADHVVQLGVDAPLEAKSFDIVIEAAGAVPSLVAALDLVRPKGAIVQLGILPKGELPVPLSELVNRELTLFGSQRFDIEMDEAVRILAATPALDTIITHVFPVDEAGEAFACAADSQASVKTLIRFRAHE